MVSFLTPKRVYYCSLILSWITVITGFLTLFDVEIATKPFMFLVFLGFVRLLPYLFKKQVAVSVSKLYAICLMAYCGAFFAVGINTFLELILLSCIVFIRMMTTFEAKEVFEEREEDSFKRVETFLGFSDD